MAADAFTFITRCNYCGGLTQVPTQRRFEHISCPDCGQTFIARHDIDLFDELPEQAPPRPLLKALGFWSPDGADPRKLVAPGFYGSELGSIVHYLRTAQSVMDYLGYSYCRFNCGIESQHMGAEELSDGEWAWPAGLAHYVETHHILLPEEFVATMRARQRNPACELIVMPGADTIYDLTFWSGWASSNAS